MEEAHYIFEKYKTECNPKNKKLIFIADECVFNDTIMHGGYECGSDGKWNKTTCVPSYCENGFVYDTKTNKCIEDICLIKEKNDAAKKEEDYNKGKVVFIISMVSFGLFLLTLIIYIITCCNEWDKATCLFFLMIPLLLLGIILVMVATLKYNFPS